MLELSKNANSQLKKILKLQKQSKLFMLLKIDAINVMTESYVNTASKQLKNYSQSMQFF